MSEATEAEARPTAREDVVFRRVGEDWLLFDPRAQEIHVLNLSAALVWSYCDGERTEAEIARAVAGAFELPSGEDDENPPDVEADVQEILEGFREAGLLK